MNYKGLSLSLCVEPLSFMPALHLCQRNDTLAPKYVNAN